MTKKTRKRGETTGKERKQPRRWRRAVLRWAFKWLALLIVWGGVATGMLVAWYAYDLPDVTRLGESQRSPSVTLVALDGTRIARFGDLYGPPVRLADLPPYLGRAVVAIEDRRFYEHSGLDFRALLRATLANLRAGRIVQGGSTLTQQLAKNVFLTPARTLKRKVQELLLALWLEQKFTKDEILTIYLNRVYLGAGTYGVEAASRRYFGKSARDLGLEEAAMIAGLLKAPSKYAPTLDLALARARARQVLASMVAAGFITASEAEAAAASPASVARRREGGAGGERYFADWVFDQLAGYAGPGAGDIVVFTTLDTRMQRAAEEAVGWGLSGEGARRGVGEAALVALAPDGAVRAMVGGSDYAKSQFNRATQALRQPGSAFKLFVYLAALEAGLTPRTVVEDAPLTIGNWKPRNYDGTYAGPVTLREAFARSLNTAAVRVSEGVSRAEVAQMARRLGITSNLRLEASLALGASEVTLVELASAYAALVNQGRGVWAYGIQEIRTGGGDTLYRRAGSGPGPVVAERPLRQMIDMLESVITEGTGRAAALPWPAAGKTGTSQDSRDAWFVGLTHDLVAGVWAGNDDGAAMKGVTGGGLPARLWARFMSAALAGTPPRPVVDPPANASTWSQGRATKRDSGR